MAEQTSLNYLNNRATFLDSLCRGMIPALDFSGAKICFDFSDFKLGTVNFSGCDLEGSKFHRAELSPNCNFAGSN
jgi:uncharacterized protein YjbI with pentapeptide repeats